MTEHEQHSEELVSRAAAALRRASVPPGPAVEILARSLAAVEAAVEAASQTPPRHFARSRTMRLAGPIAAALILSLGGFLYFGSMTPAGSSVAWAEVAAKLRDARTLTYVMTSHGPGQRLPFTAKNYFKEPGQMRLESSNGLISIMDGGPQNVLYLDTVTKTGYFNRVKGTPPAKPQGSAKATGTFVPSFQVTDRSDTKADKFHFSGFEKLKNLAKAKGEPIGKKKIGDVEALGFRIVQMGLEFTAWVDPHTRLPLAIEQTIKVGGREFTTTMSDFVFDPPLDDALFSLTPPAGYKISEGQLQTLSSEESLVELLRLYAEASGGGFPPKLDDWADYDKTLNTDRFKKPGVATDPKYLQFVQTTTRATMFILEHKNQLTYRPEGVKLGQADKLLLWYKPADGEKVRAIYGDLRTEDVSAEQLPQKPAK